MKYPECEKIEQLQETILFLSKFWDGFISDYAIAFFPKEKKIEKISLLSHVQEFDDGKEEYILISSFFNWVMYERGFNCHLIVRNDESLESINNNGGGILHESTENLIYEFFDIDRNKLEKERRSMLENLT